MNTERIVRFNKTVYIKDLPDESEFRKRNTSPKNRNRHVTLKSAEQVEQKYQSKATTTSDQPQTEIIVPQRRSDRKVEPRQSKSQISRHSRRMSDGSLPPMKDDKDNEEDGSSDSSRPNAPYWYKKKSQYLV